MKDSLVKKYFDENSEFWIMNSYEKQGHKFPTAFSRLQKVFKILAEKFPGSDATIADLGCGGGHLCFELASRGYRARGIDASDSMMDEVTKKANELPEDIRERLRFFKRDISETGLESNTYDAVTSLGVIGYLPDDAGLFREAARLLKPEGLFIVSCRNRLFNMVSLSDYTLKEIDQGGAKKLVEEIRELFQPISPEDSKIFLEALSKATHQSISNESQDLNRSKRSSSNERTFSVDPRQHTPKEILAVAEAHGFKHERFLGVHPHLLMASVNHLLPPFVYNALSSSLDVLDRHPLSLIWSSVFIGVFRKTA